jgi:hypothetical protein
MARRTESGDLRLRAPRDQGNSEGHTDRIVRQQAGLYEAYFNEIGNGFYPIGVVTAISAGARTNGTRGCSRPTPGPG